MTSDPKRCDADRPDQQAVPIGKPRSQAELDASARLPRRLRMLMGAVSLTVCFSAALDYAGMDAVEDRNHGSQEALNLAGRQRMLSQRLAQLALRLVHEDDDPAGLGRLLAEGASQMHHDRERLLALPPFAKLASRAPDVLPLTEAALKLSRTVDSADQSRSPEGRTQAARDLVLAADAFLPRMEATVAELQASTEQIVEETERTHALYMAGLALLTSLAALGLGEQLARRMALQHARLQTQATDLERLALVAERTHNAVVITDPEGRVTWVNEGFSRLSGYSLAEAIGRSPGTLLQFEGTDRSTRERLRVAIADRKPIQVEILNRSKHGVPYWLYLDIQPVFSPLGDCTGFIAVETDITDQVQERERLAALLRALPAGVVEQDADGVVTSANPEACRILGLRLPQLLGQEAIDARWHTVEEDGRLMPPAQRPSARVLLESCAVRDITMGVAFPEGGRRWLRVNAEPMRGTDDACTGVVSSFVDVSEAITQRRLLALTVDAAGLGSWNWNLPSGNVEFNDRWWRMLGHEAGPMAATVATWESLVHPDDLADARGALQRHFDDPTHPYRCEFRIQRADGSWAWVMAAGAVVDRQSDGTPLQMAGIHLDITPRKALEARLASAALTDALTGLPNRAALQDRLAKSAARAARRPDYRYAVLFMDFDRFKQVNDSLGHEAGDELLRQIASRLRSVLRPGDDLARIETERNTAARLGGDEFVALLEPLARAEDAQSVAQRLLDALGEPYQLGGKEVCSTVSIGIVTSDRTDRDPEALLRDADTAMYEAKRRGRARYVVFSCDMHERVRQALDLEADLRHALRCPDQLFVLYQPIVDLASGRPRGVEALARWRHPIRGMVPPAEFIPLAEDCGLISELGEMVLETACRDIAGWHRTGGALEQIRLSVNLSRAQLRRPGLPQRIADTLATTGLSPRRLRLEITESLAMQEPSMLAVLHDLRALGVSLALDDFGTGYSSLASLDQMPLDAVKIDRGFVQRMVGNSYQTALIEATVRVATSLSLEVVAEGVESAEQAQLLRQAGCPMAQGWLFGKPATANDLLQTLVA